MQNYEQKEELWERNLVWTVQKIEMLMAKYLRG